MSRFENRRPEPLFDFDEVAFFHVVCRPSRKFDDGVGHAEADAGPRREPFLLGDLATDEPEGVDVERDEHHVEAVAVHVVEAEDERVVVRNRAAEHQPARLREERICRLDVRGERRVVSIPSVDEFHGRGFGGIRDETSAATPQNDPARATLLCH